jgi:hypothetical protein
MAECDSCGTPTPLRGILVDVMKHMNEHEDIPQKWCLECIRGTKEEKKQER